MTASADELHNLSLSSSCHELVWGVPIKEGIINGSTGYDIINSFTRTFPGLLHLLSTTNNRICDVEEYSIKLYTIQHITDYAQLLDPNTPLMISIEYPKGFDFDDISSSIKGEVTYRALCEETQTRFIEMQEGLSLRINTLEYEKKSLMEQLERIERVSQRRPPPSPPPQSVVENEGIIRNGLITTRLSRPTTSSLHQKGLLCEDKKYKKKSVTGGGGGGGGARRASYSGGGSIEYRGHSKVTDGRRSLGSDDGAILLPSSSRQQQQQQPQQSNIAHHQQQQQQEEEAFTPPPSPSVINNRSITTNDSHHHQYHHQPPRSTNSLVDYNGVSNKGMSSLRLDISTRTQGELSPRGGQQETFNGAHRHHHRQQQQQLHQPQQQQQPHPHWTSSFGNCTPGRMLGPSTTTSLRASTGISTTTSMNTTPVQSRAFSIASAPRQTFQSHHNMFSPRTTLLSSRPNNTSNIGGLPTGIPPPPRIAQPTPRTFYEAAAAQQPPLFRIPMPASSSTTMTQIPRPSPMTLRPPPPPPPSTSGSNDVSRLLSSQSSLIQQCSTT